MPKKFSPGRKIANRRKATRAAKTLPATRPSRSGNRRMTRRGY
jgi:hypothetical protein